MALPVWDVPVQLHDVGALPSVRAAAGALPRHEEKVAAVSALGGEDPAERHRR